jgi:L-threonylcarbamoyladenylate synthase
VKGRRPRPLDDGDSGEARVSGHLSWAKLRKRSSVKTNRQLSGTITPMAIISNCTASIIRDAALALREGHLVAFPTETVYGLGADATNEKAVARIYEVKGRPTDHPLIVHISSINNLDKWAKGIPEYATKLARAFWPGPMTLILPRTELAKDFITGDQNNVGIRVPEHTVALELLKEFEAQGGYGVAAPSANRFGKVSPTTSNAVIDELGNYLSLDDQILDGGSSQIGIESTIVDCTKNVPEILRPGYITTEMIEKLLLVKLSVLESKLNEIKAPGLLKAHYSPNAQVVLNGVPQPGQGFIALSSIPTPNGVIRLASPNNNEEYARSLYAALRLADARGIRTIQVIPPNEIGIGMGINNRLLKSAHLK